MLEATELIINTSGCKGNGFMAETTNFRHSFHLNKKVNLQSPAATSEVEAQLKLEHS
jgi:hypothetical protein